MQYLDELQELCESLERISKQIDLSLNNMFKTRHVDVDGKIIHLDTHLETFVYNQLDEYKEETHEICNIDNFCIECGTEHEI